MTMTTIGLDLAKSAFHLFAVNPAGGGVCEKEGAQGQARVGLFSEPRAVRDGDESLRRG